MKKLILTADDYGASDFIDRGIEKAIRAGRINTVSAFVTHQDSEERLRKLLNIRQEEGLSFNIGLHFSITSGRSVLNRKTSLTEENLYFCEASYYPFGKIVVKELKEELLAQLSKLDGILGEERIDHVSNHHGIVYLDIDFFKNYIETVNDFKREKYTINIPIRSSRTWKKQGLKSKKNFNFLDILYPTIKEGIKLGFWKKIFEASKIEEKEIVAASSGVKHPNCLADTIYGRPEIENILFLLDQFRDKDFSAEFMFHLGDGQNLENEIHGINLGYFETRKKELESLLSDDFADKIVENNIQKTNFSDLWNLPNTPQPFLQV